MFEDVTYEDILQRMLDRVPSTVDKREGSVIYDALAPAAVELQLMYMELDIILNESFADTASREYLIRRAAERGLTPEPATYAILLAESTPSNLELTIGARFSLGDLNYVITSKISAGKYQAQCETAGTVGNSQFGTLIPIDYIAGLESIALTRLLIPGEDEEGTEALRERYFNSFDSKAYGGNVDDYLEKTNAIAGVGATRVTPIWNGGGTVLLTILDSEYSAATQTLIDAVQEEIDPTQDGSGVGLAPIGHVVTVQTASEVTINISTSISFSDGHSWASEQADIEAAVEDYLLGLREEWSTSNAVVRISQIESHIMGVEGVVDIQNTEINGSASNLTLTDYQIPVLGVITNA